MKQMEADVVVVAGGVAGLAAAITAAEKGASVIILEKANTTGGTGNMAMGIFGVESRLQAKMLVGLTPKQAFDKFMEYTHWQVDAKLEPFFDFFSFLSIKYVILLYCCLTFLLASLITGKRWVLSLSPYLF